MNLFAGVYADYSPTSCEGAGGLPSRSGWPGGLVNGMKKPTPRPQANDLLDHRDTPLQPDAPQLQNGLHFVGYSDGARRNNGEAAVAWLRDSRLIRGPKRSGAGCIFGMTSSSFSLPTPGVLQGAREADLGRRSCGLGISTGCIKLIATVEAPLEDEEDPPAPTALGARPAWCARPQRPETVRPAP